MTPQLVEAIRSYLNPACYHRFATVWLCVFEVVRIFHSLPKLVPNAIDVAQCSRPPSRRPHNGQFDPPFVKCYKSTFYLGSRAASRVVSRRFPDTGESARDGLRVVPLLGVGAFLKSAMVLPRRWRAGGQFEAAPNCVPQEWCAGISFPEIALSGFRAYVDIGEPVIRHLNGGL
jgi:hypothetical protein